MSPLEDDASFDLEPVKKDIALRLKTEVEEKSLTIFGSGWTWLVADLSNNCDLSLVSAQNQDHGWYFDSALFPKFCIDM